MHEAGNSRSSRGYMKVVLRGYYLTVTKRRKIGRRATKSIRFESSKASWVITRIRARKTPPNYGTGFL
jgi:hypothetical protein